MKKLLLMVLAVTMVSSLAFGQTQVLSRNAVGYVKVDAWSNGFTFASVPFNAFSNTVPGVMGSQLVGNNSPGFADQLMKWSPSNQQYITYYKRASGEWRKVGETNATTDTLSPGEAFFIRNRRSTNQTVYLMGEVPDSRSAITTTVFGLPGFQMVSYSYPVEMSITNLTLFSTAIKNASPGFADQIIKWDPVSQAYIKYYARSTGWRKVGETNTTSDTLAPSEGFFYLRRGLTSFTWTENKPYTWP